MPRALFVSYTGLGGGAERLLVDVARRLDPPPLIACPDGALAESARAAGLRVLPLRERPIDVRASARDRIAAPLRIAGHAREIRFLCRTLRPDTLVAWGMRSMLAAAAGAPESQRVLFQHNDLLPPGATGRAVRRAARRADKVVCVSGAVARDLGLESAHVIHPGVDLDGFHPGPGGGHALLLGAIVDWKRPEVAIEAAERAGVPLRIAGAPLGNDGEALERRLRERAGPEVMFTGPISDPTAALREAGCLIHGSDVEPWGLVLVEALASGTPVVAPAAGGPAEIVTPECGVLYPPGDA
ncbi:MAG: glycosyltransferase, partial [Thermoleophilaceae bacterium]|nr:glycosyltransferase [Thermoleophilaceae bacterium]